VKVVPFDLGGLPAVRGRDAAATRAALRVLASLPSRWQVDLPPFGPVTLTVAGPLPETRPPQPSDQIALPIARGRDRGSLTVASSFAARLVDVALRAGAALSPSRGLGPAERGVLVAVLAPVLDGIGWSLGLGPAPPITGGGATLALRLDGAFGSSWLALDLPVTTPVSPVSSVGWRARAAALPLVARIELARTELPTSSLLGLASGDALVFDGTSASGYPADGPWDGRLAIGPFIAPLRIDPDGALEVAGDFQMIGAPARAAIIDKERVMDVTGPTEKLSTVLAAAPIEVVAELGRITLRGDEVLGLAPGVVLTVAVDRRHAIALRVGGQIWAEGELVAVDGELGVRVTRVVSGSDAK
jgi:flagellar motor switch/type III secretory pathway protein FliN